MANVYNISSNQCQLTLIINGYAPVTVDNIDPEAKVLEIGETEVGGSEMTLEGNLNQWSKNALIPVTITLSASSTALKQLRAIARLQRNRSGINAQISEVTAIWTTPQGTETFTGGTLISSILGISADKEKLEAIPLKFNFLEII